MKRRTTILMLLPVLLLPSGCRGFGEDAPAGGRRVAVSVEALVEDYDGAVTKSSLGASETAVSVWGVGAYKDGYLVDWANSTTKPTLNLELGTTYSIFALANTPGAADFFEDLTTEGWHVYNAVESFPGGHYLAGYLPMSSARSYTPAANAQTVSVTFTRLVAKYNVRIEENFLDPNSTFTVTGLAMRNSPVSARPFQVLPSGFGIAAQSASEVGDGKDRASAADISTLNSGGTVSLYTLENLQGTTSNTDPWNKTTTAPATYLELTGTWSTSGASATMTYRMYLGNNATNDFNITRNTSYDLTLSLSEAGFGHLGSSWKIERTNFSDSRGVDVEGDFTTNRIIVYDDGEEVQYYLNPNYAGMDYTVSLDIVDDAGLAWTRTGPANNVLSISTSLRDCLGMPHDEFVITTRDGAELQRVPVEVWHRLDFVDYDLGGEATDPMDVTVGQKLIYEIGGMDIFPQNGYPYANLGFRYGRYSTWTAIPTHCFDVQDATFGPGSVVLENWAMNEPADAPLYLEVYDRSTGRVLTRDGLFRVEKPTIRWVDWVGTGGYSRTQPASELSFIMGSGSRALLLQFVSPGGNLVEFNQELLQELDLEPDLSASGNSYLTITPVFTTEWGDVNYPRQVYNVSISDPAPRTVGSFVEHYMLYPEDSHYRMPALTATAPMAHAPAQLPCSLSLRPIRLEVLWSVDNHLLFRVDHSGTGEVNIAQILQKSPLCFSISNARSALSPLAGMYTVDELYDEAVEYTADHWISDIGHVTSRGPASSGSLYISNPSDKYVFWFGNSSTALNRTMLGPEYFGYDLQVKGRSNAMTNLWLDNTHELSVPMTFPTHCINLVFSSPFETLLPLYVARRLPVDLVSCPSDVTLYIDGFNVQSGRNDWGQIIGN